MSSDSKKSDDRSTFSRYQIEAREKMNLAPYNLRKVIIDYDLDEKKVQYVIRDGGPGFDYKKLPDPKDPESFLKPSGRGVLMIQTFCDEVKWNETGNEITLVKYRDGEQKQEAKGSGKMHNEKTKNIDCG